MRQMSRWLRTIKLLSQLLNRTGADSTGQAIGGEAGIRTHGTVTRTTVFEFYDSHADPCRPVAKRVLHFRISVATILACDAPWYAVLRGWFANWFAIPSHLLTT